MGGGGDETEEDLKKIWYECVDQECPNVNVVAGILGVGMKRLGSIKGRELY
jgi:hypothetical protein